MERKHIHVCLCVYVYIYIYTHTKHIYVVQYVFKSTFCVTRFHKPLTSVCDSIR